MVYWLNILISEFNFFLTFTNTIIYYIISSTSLENDKEHEPNLFTIILKQKGHVSRFKDIQICSLMFSIGWRRSSVCER